jgi:hypothetical protein
MHLLLNKTGLSLGDEQYLLHALRRIAAGIEVRP